MVKMLNKNRYQKKKKKETPADKTLCMIWSPLTIEKEIWTKDAKIDHSLHSDCLAGWAVISSPVSNTYWYLPIFLKLIYIPLVSRKTRPKSHLRFSFRFSFSLSERERKKRSEHLAENPKWKGDDRMAGCHYFKIRKYVSFLDFSKGNSIKMELED